MKTLNSIKHTNRGVIINKLMITAYYAEFVWGTPK